MRKSFVRWRAEATPQDPFPTFPVYDSLAPCHGLLIFAPPDRVGDLLGPLRKDITGLWYGQFPGDNAQSFLLVTLVSATTIIEPQFSNALRLRVSRSGHLKSFQEDGSGELQTTSSLNVTSLTRLHILWQGDVHEVSVASLSPISISTLWEGARVTVHTSHPFRRVGAVPVTAKKVRDEEGESSPVEVKGEEMPVRRAKKETFGDGPDAWALTDKSLRDLEERTKLGSILKSAWGQLFKGRGVGQSSGRGRTPWQSSKSNAPQEERGPSMLEQLSGWVRWHTPLGDSLRKQFGDRLNLVEKLIQSGKIDDALKLGLKLGKDGAKDEKKTRNIFPTRLPGARSTLDFSIISSKFSMPILGDSSLWQMKDRYRKLAEDLEARGDYRRAAYIRSQLLSDHLRAIETLEKGGLLQIAAKLAHDSGQHPRVLIRLLYKMGDSDAALALAKRTACFEELVVTSRDGDAAFHAFVVAAWTDQLTATNQFERALLVTDELVGNTQGKEVDVHLIAARRNWLSEGLRKTNERFSAELTARALLEGLDGDGVLSAQALTGFPDTPMLTDQYPFADGLRHLQSVLQTTTEEYNSNLFDVFRSIHRHADPQSSQQTIFWEKAAAHILEPLSRALFERTSERMNSLDLEYLRSMLHDARLPVLAADIGKLRSIYSEPLPAERKWSVPKTMHEKSKIVHACLVGGGDILLSRENAILELFSVTGKQLWAGMAREIVGMVAIGTGADVIILQKERAETVRLSRFSTQDHTMKDIGVLTLRAWHDVTSDTQWMLQIDGEVGAIDLAKLCAPVPEIEFLWSFNLTDRLQTVAFFHDTLSPAWITRDISDARNGLHELWVLNQGRELKTHLLTFTRQGFNTDHRTGFVSIEPGNWRFTGKNGSYTVTYLDEKGGGEHRGRTMKLSPWSHAEEKRQVGLMRERIKSSYSLMDRFFSADFCRVYTEHSVPSEDRATSFLSINSTTPGHIGTFDVHHEFESPVSVLARGSGPPDHDKQIDHDGLSHFVLLTDPTGCLFQVDMRSGRVQIL